MKRFLCLRSMLALFTGEITAIPFTVLLVAASFGNVDSAGAATIFDAVDDFSTVSNSETSTWSYRYSSNDTRDGSYALMTDVSDVYPLWNPGAPYWNAGSVYPAIGANQSGSPIMFVGNADTFTWPDQTIWMHPSASGLAVLSWLCPSAGAYDISFSFADLDPNGVNSPFGNGIQWFVDLNDSSGVLAQGAIAEGGPSTGLMMLRNITLSAGDRVNFVVSANGFHEFDSTAVTAMIIEAAPVAIAGLNQTVHCTTPAGATVTLNGSASYDPDGRDDLDYEWSVAEDSGVTLDHPDQAITTGTFSIGVHEVTLTVYDIDEFGVRKDGVGVASVSITVVDDDPPVALVTTSTASLWPANGNIIPVTIFVEASDTCSDPDDLVMLCTVSSNQADDTNGTGNRTGDVDGHDGYSAPVEITLQSVGDGLYGALIYLRAERDPSANAGRIYSIGLSVMDGAGNLGNASTTVVVPHDGKKK